ncbi:MAG: phosphoribosylamine--glycine ligase, partial [Oscillospiraceae bacterium]|nr:phosphoribosylamine--glycine ligase [Oscillospiraceae bacterium]
MKLMVIGGGGREHAIVKKLKENPEVTEIFVLPGNAGMSADAVCVPIKALDLPGIVRFAAEQKIDYAVVTPDDPLAAGAVDALEAAGIACFGPNQRAAVIESSKIFAKDLMKRYGIPTAKYETFDRLADALTYLETAPIPTVIKADGIDLGKGVVIANTREEAKNAVTEMMANGRFGRSGERVVIEEFL